MKRAKILSASAGSGKTFRLVLKYICDIIERPDRYRNILAVTFTNKATEEMKSRIINEIHRLAANQPSQYLQEVMLATQLSEPHIRERALKARTKILHDYSRFTVLTIDRFFQRILRAFINELGLDLNYNIEIDTDLLLERSADSLIESIAHDPDIKKWLMTFAEERLEQGHKWDMRKELRSLGKELFKENIAKRVKESISKSKLQEIINELVEHDNAILHSIKTLGEDACKCMKKWDVQEAEFKGKSKSFTHRFRKYAEGDISAPSDSMLKATKDMKEWYNNDARGCVKAAAAELQPILQEICTLYANNIDKMNTTKILRNNHHSFALLSDLYHNIESICQEENIMVLDNTKEILTEFIDHSNAPFIYEKVGNRYDHYMIDEFQDTSRREWRNIRPLLLEALASNPEASVFIVGDIKQSIYRWRGGDWRLLNGGVERDLGSDNTEIQHLELNYRSLKNIVDFNRILIDKVVDIDNIYLNNLVDNALCNNRISELTHASLHNIIKEAYIDNNQTAFIKSEENGIAEICLFDKNLVKESPFIEAIEDAISRGYRYCDIMLLVRNGEDCRKVVNALYAHKNKLAAEGRDANFNVLTSDSLTIDLCDIVQFIIATLRLAVNPSDDIEHGKFNHYLGRPFETKFSDEDRALLHRIAHLSPMEAFEVIVDNFNLSEQHSRIAYLQAMHEQIISFSNNHIADIQHYLEWWVERGYKENLSVEMTDNTIEITTIHKSKGLERAVVIIPYCTWEMVPSTQKRPIVWSTADKRYSDITSIGSYPVAYNCHMGESAFSEDYYKELVMSHVDGVNLLYVAITRAAKELYIYISSDLNSQKSSNKSDEIINTTPLIIKAVSAMREAHDERDESNNITHRRYTYGEKIKHHTPKQRNASSHNIILSGYPTAIPDIAVCYPSHRYVEEGLTPGTTQCRTGIMLHRIFEKAESIDDLYNAIKRMSLDCLIDNDTAERLRANIDQAMQDERAKEWFGDHWDDIKTEAEILHNGIVRRPDRVMIAGNRAVVVDYKFGLTPNRKNNDKVREYMHLLDSMQCYETIEGYVWYIAIGHIEPIEMAK